MKNALILGCSYLGSRIARLWSDQGIQVVGTTRSRDRFDSIAACGAQPVEWDALTSTDRLPAAEVVVYAVSFGGARDAARVDRYLAGLERALSQLSTPGRFVFISSTGVYGDSGGNWVDEDTPPCPGDPSAKACWDAEQLVLQHSARAGWSTVRLRLAGIYGPGRMIGAQQLRAGEPIAADPLGWINLIHVVDAARAVVAAASVPAPAALYNVADGQPVRRADFYQTVAEMLGVHQMTFDPEKARRARGDRKVRAERMREDLLTDLTFPDYRAGLADCLSDPDRPNENGLIEGQRKARDS